MSGKAWTTDWCVRLVMVRVSSNDCSNRLEMNGTILPRRFCSGETVKTFLNHANQVMTGYLLYFEGSNVRTKMRFALWLVRLLGQNRFFPTCMFPGYLCKSGHIHFFFTENMIAVQVNWKYRSALSGRLGIFRQPIGLASWIIYSSFLRPLLHILRRSGDCLLERTGNGSLIFTSDKNTSCFGIHYLRVWCLPVVGDINMKLSVGTMYLFEHDIVPG